MHKQSNAALTGSDALNASADSPVQNALDHGAAKRRDVIVNVTFTPKGLVNTINERPEHIAPQDWFDRLCYAAPSAYQALSGGRGSFCIGGDEFDVIWRNNAK